MTEAFPFLEPVRVQAAAADIHHRACQALRGERARSKLSGHRRRVLKSVVEVG
jgi:hypothetical protein